MLPSLVAPRRGVVRAASVELGRRRAGGSEGSGDVEPPPQRAASTEPRACAMARFDSTTRGGAFLVDVDLQLPALGRRRAGRRSGGGGCILSGLVAEENASANEMRAQLERLHAHGGGSSSSSSSLSLLSGGRRGLGGVGGGGGSRGSRSAAFDQLLTALSTGHMPGEGQAEAAAAAAAADDDSEAGSVDGDGGSGAGGAAAKARRARRRGGKAARQRRVVPRAERVEAELAQYRENDSFYHMLGDRVQRIQADRRAKAAE
jgi:hypothetical protein